jgi:3-oxoacyl-[acyl-carrier-protein] synthase-3
MGGAEIAERPVVHHAVVRSTKHILPVNRVSNEEIVERLIDGSGVRIGDSERSHVRARAADIQRKTGLVERRFFAPRENPVEVAYAVLGELLDRARAPWSELDGIIVSSSSIHGFPGVSQQLVARARDEHPDLGDPFVLDIGSNACTSFMYGLGIAASLGATQGYRHVACIAVEFSSRCIEYRTSAFGTSTLFGDAVAGMLVAPSGDGPARVASVRTSSWIDGKRIRHIRGAGMAACDPGAPVPEPERWYMSGPPVALGAIEILVSEVRRYQDAGVAVDWLIPHQANLTRILHPACDALGIPRERLCTSFERTGNTSSASIPLLLDELLASRRGRPGDSVVLVGFGASFSIGSAVLTLA